MRKFLTHIILFTCIFIISCTGSKKYFKAAEKLEKQGLVNEAAEFYYQSLQRKPTNVDARIKLKEVGQKYVSSLASDFFRNYNTQQFESSLESYERLKDFSDRTDALNVQLDYPKTYEEDYQIAKESYCLKNHHQAALLVNQKKFKEALTYITKVNKYNRSYKNIAQLEIIATCEPLYQSAILNLESKNYAYALQSLSAITLKTDNYKDSKELYEMASAQNLKTFILFEPAPSNNSASKQIETELYSNFNQAALEKLTSVKIINNSPFQNTSASMDFSKSTNVDMIQAIRKATGADYFYFYGILNANNYNSGLSKTQYKGFQEVKTRKNDTLVITEYIPFNYYNVKAQSKISYDFQYKLINAYTNQLVSTQVKSVQSSDAIEYQEFQHTFKGNVNTLYPNNPQQGALSNLNARSWRNLFTARNTLKSSEELKADAYSQTVKLFVSSTNSMK